MQAGRAGGDVEGYYLSPSVPAVGDHLEGVVRELVRAYPVDGFHLDFIRYPSPEYDYARPALEDFRRVRGTSDLLGRPRATPRPGTNIDGTSCRRWPRAWWPRRAPSGPADHLGGGGSRRGSAVSQKYQSWPGWLAERLLDALCPMTYTQDTRIFQQQLETARERAGATRARLGRDRRVPARRPAGIVEKVGLARQSGARGVVLFSNESLDPADLRRLRDQAFPPRLAEDAGTQRGGIRGRNPIPKKP